MEVKVYRQDGSEAGKTAQLDESVFGIEPNDHAIWLDVRRIQAHGRQGTHKAKERNETAGSRRKLYRQKGTGHARAGDAKSPLRRSGGTIFGPRPHEYRLKVNRKTRQLARRSALTYKAQGDAVKVVEDFSIESANTRGLKDILAGLSIGGAKVLLLTASHSPALYQSGRNLPKVSVCHATQASTADLLGAGILVIQEGALDALSGQLGSTTQAA